MADPSPDRDERTQRARMEAGALYRADDPELVEAHLRARRLTDRFNRTSADDTDRQRSILIELLGSLGAGTVIRAPFSCDYGSYLCVGERCFVNFGLVALDAAPITIGDDVQIGPGVQLLAASHPVDPELRRTKWESAEPVVVEDNVWLGGGVIVLPGVTVGRNTVVGAGAVVTANLPADVVAAGTPARIIRRRGEER
ncbi:MAG: sugar O-acetyltransferase [Acidimicrobiales bacterium]